MASLQPTEKSVIAMKTGEAGMKKQSLAYLIMSSYEIAFPIDRDRLSVASSR
jgi:hypothetical protein